MKATLEFDLNEDEDKQLYKDTSMARQYSMALMEIKDEIRSLYKYNRFTDGTLIESIDCDTLVNKIHDKFYSVLSDLYINPDDI